MAFDNDTYRALLDAQLEALAALEARTLQGGFHQSLAEMPTTAQPLVQEYLRLLEAAEAVMETTGELFGYVNDAAGPGSSFKVQTDPLVIEIEEGACHG